MRTMFHGRANKLALFCIMFLLLLHFNRLNAFSGGIVKQDMTILYQKEAYIINETIIVKDNAILVIEPGVTLQFAEKCGMIIRGALTANGTERSRITFSSVRGNPSRSSTAWRKTARLTEGNGFNEGWLEIFYNGTWEPICDKSWDDINTFVACRELGFAEGKWRFWGGTYETSSLTDVRCQLTDYTVIDCHYRRIYQDCGR